MSSIRQDSLTRRESSWSRLLLNSMHLVKAQDHGMSHFCSELHSSRIIIQLLFFSLMPAALVLHLRLTNSLQFGRHFYRPLISNHWMYMRNIACLKPSLRIWRVISWYGLSYSHNIRKSLDVAIIALGHSLGFHDLFLDIQVVIVLNWNYQFLDIIMQ